MSSRKSDSITFESLKIIAKSHFQARQFVHTLGLTSVKEWEQYCKSGNKPTTTKSDCQSSGRLNSSSDSCY
jgi:hypothetical protein